MYVQRQRHRRQPALAPSQIHLDDIAPSDSIAFMSYCVTTMPFVARSSGTRCVAAGRAEITVPHG